MSVHDGHRQRLKDRFLAEGLDNFTDIQVLELLLFYCIPRKDTNELAHVLLKRFGGLTQVLEAKPEDLMRVEGVGESTALFLNLIPAAGRYYDVERIKCGAPPKAAGNICFLFSKDAIRKRCSCCAWMPSVKS